MAKYCLLGIVQYHSCKNVLEEKRVPVDVRIMGVDNRLVGYCSNCDVYKYNKFESSNPQVVGDHINKLQKDTNLKMHHSPFHVRYDSERK